MWALLGARQGETARPLVLWRHGLVESASAGTLTAEEAAMAHVKQMAALGLHGIGTDDEGRVILTVKLCDGPKAAAGRTVTVTLDEFGESWLRQRLEERARQPV